jgi:hypothetical protein
VCIYKLLNTPGLHHYNDVDFYGRITEEVKTLDKLKREMCMKIGITVIDVPYWWDYDKVFNLCLIE